MTRFVFATIILAVSGCAKDRIDPDPFEYRFEKTAERAEPAPASSRKVSIRFDGVPFGQAMTILSQESNTPIVWSSDLDEKQAVGTFQGVNLATVLDMLARRNGASVTEIGGVFYLGQIRKEDRAFAVVRMPPVAKAEILGAIQSAGSSNGTVSAVGSCLWVCDDIESVRKILAAVESIRERSERSYVAEVYFIRTSEEHFVRLSADLQIRQVDIFASAFNVEELFSMFVDADGKSGWAQIDQRPVLYLSEGRKVVFEDGDEITREQKSVSETGYMETSGYAKFNDGLKLELELNRVSDLSYAIDLSLSISVFDKSDSAAIPRTQKSSLKSPGLLVRDSQVYYVGSLRRDMSGGDVSLFGLGGDKSHDMLTIWLRVRELRGS